MGKFKKKDYNFAKGSRNVDEPYLTSSFASKFAHTLSCGKRDMLLVEDTSNPLNSFSRVLLTNSVCRSLDYSFKRIMLWKDALAIG